ncbi:hypothetical protein Clacol_001637 [Clathrus columnatus]|uniref:Large ribosomal subunit protein uL6 alpha-beta domain-containing protein n=1 Tax=Clathrus columnatus TaxID=1419009 RepID=A0AAV5A699_9AGAM|nr:hypothetical protein Clacol_001637 [Clathrus columnatus]
MRDICQNEELTIPEGVNLSIKSRVIEVEGPRGRLTKNVRHVNMDIQIVKSKSNTVILSVWQGSRKHVACLRTIKSMIQNMITGVTKGFSYKMRAVYAHFPINCIIQESGKALEIRNFLGEKVRTSFLKGLQFVMTRLIQIVRHVNMLDGVVVSESKAQKDELILEGNDIDNVSQSAASIQGACRVRNKDIRKRVVYLETKVVKQVNNYYTLSNYAYIEQLSLDVNAKLALQAKPSAF